MEVSALSEALAAKVSRFPDSPGVYLIKDVVGRVIYVGKARFLRRRVRSYLPGNSTQTPRLKALRAQMADIEFIATDNEVEALILESTLIKEYSPRYNVNLKDDKDYPYLRLTGGTYPRLEYLRLSQKGSRRSGRERQSGEEVDGAQYFGPFTNARAVQDTMKLLGKIFPLRRCRRPLNGAPSAERPCLNFQMRRCLAPCQGSGIVPPEQYEGLVRQVALFLDGRHRELERQLKSSMAEAAAGERYEEAARLRDQLHALEQVIDRQQKVLSVRRMVDQDVLALVRDKDEKEAAVQLFKIREGRLLSQEHFSLSGVAGTGDAEALEAFIQSYYSRGARPPAEIILSEQPEGKALLQEWLQITAGYRVNLVTPRRGYRKEMVEMARRNGQLQLQEERRRAWTRELLPLEELGRLAGMEKAPRRIEGYDISHLRGNEAVGSMVVFEQGRPFKDGYRHFYLRNTPAGDDYAAMKEVLMRRAARFDWPQPDLLMVDGGKGQLRAARKALAGSALAAVPLLSLAKDPEQIFLDGVPSPVVLPAGNTMLQLLQRIRDEAHRFAVDYHRRLRRRDSTRSLLEEVPGLGPKRRTALLEHFGDINKIYRATEEEFREVPGISRSMAGRLFAYLHR